MEFDCLGLFIALHAARFGHVIPDPAVSVALSIRPKVERQLRGHFKRVDHIQEGDALLFRQGRSLRHVGYALDAREMLHTERESVGSCIERFNNAAWKHRLIGVYRFEA